MPTLRNKVDAFCKEAGSKVSDSDKLRSQIGTLKQEMKKLKDTHKHELHLAKAKTAKAPKSPKSPKAKAAKAPKVKQQVQMKPLPALPAQAEPMMPAPAPSLAPAAGPKGGRTRRRLRR
jgi:hypothetical protein